MAVRLERAAARGDAEGRTTPRGRSGPVLVGRSPSDIQRDAAREVELLVDELEPTLNPHQRRLLHQLRLAAETYGAIRATTGLRISAPR